MQLMDTVSIVQQSSSDLLQQIDIESLGGADALFGDVVSDVDWGEMKVEDPDFTPPATPVTSQTTTARVVSTSQSILKPGITSLLTSQTTNAATAARAITFNGAAQGASRIITTNGGAPNGTIKLVIPAQQQQVSTAGVHNKVRIQPRPATSSSSTIPLNKNSLKITKRK